MPLFFCGLLAGSCVMAMAASWFWRKKSASNLEQKEQSFGSCRK